MYSTADIMNEKPQVADFLNYAISNVTSVINEVGYFPSARASWMRAAPSGLPQWAWATRPPLA